jgi:hypothetical protein
MIVIDFIQDLANLILGLFVLRQLQTFLAQRAPQSEFTNALGYLLH